MGYKLLISELQELKVDQKFIGVPYLANGKTLEGTDCSGEVWLFLKECGIGSPVESDDAQVIIKEFIRRGQVIRNKEELRPLDIIIFKYNNEIYHAGVYIGYGKFLQQNCNTRSGIGRLSSLWGNYFYYGIRPTELYYDNEELYNEIKDKRIEFIFTAIALAAYAAATFIVPGILAGSWVFAAVAGAISGILYAGLAMGISALASSLMPKPNFGAGGAAEGSPRYSFGPLQSTASSDLPVAILYGELKVAGNAIYQSDPGEEVYRCDILCEGEVNSITDIRVNDVPIGELEGCSVTSYTGTVSQTVDSRFSNRVPGLRNLAYLALTLKTSDKLKGGFPAVTCVVQGTKVETWNGINWTTAKTYSNNPAACVRDFLINTRYGIGLPKSLLDEDSFGEVYDYCNIDVDDGVGGTEDRYTINYVIDAKKPAVDILGDTLITCGGFLVWSGNKLKLRTEKVENTVQNFTMSNIVEGSFSYQYVSKDAMVNRIKLLYIDPDQNYTKVFALAEDKVNQDERAQIEGGEGVIEREVALLGVTKFSRASRLANMFLKISKATPMTCQFKVGIYAIHCEPGDIVTVSHDVPNWTNKPFRIYAMEEEPNDEATVTCKEYNESLYDDSYGSSITAYQYGTPPNALKPVANVSDVTISESNYLNKDGVYVSDIDCVWTAPLVTDFLAYYEVQLKKGGGSYEVVGTTGGTTYTIPNVEVGQTYYVRVHTFSIEGLRSSGSVSNVLVVAGKTEAMGSVTGFTNTFTNEIKFTWNPLPSGDLWGYEIRDIDAGWASGDSHLVWHGNATNYTIVRSSSRAPGTYYIKALDNSGNYSAAAVSTTPTNAAPVAPTLSGTDFFNVCKLNWNDVGDKDLLFYEIWKSVSGDWVGEETREMKVAAGNFSGGISVIVKSPETSGDTFYWKALGVDTYGSGDFSTAYTNEYVGIDVSVPDGSITETKLADDSVSTPKLQANSVTSDKVTTGELITLSAQIKDAIINDAKVLSLDVTKLISGSITGKTITGGTLQTASGDSRVVMSSDSLVAYDNASNEIFKILLTGADVGDVTFGNYAGNKGANWDKSSGTFVVKGQIVAASGDFTGTVNVGVAGKVYIDGANEVIKVYDASNNLRVELGKLA